MLKNILQQFLDSNYPPIKSPEAIFVYDMHLTDSENSSGTAKNFLHWAVK